VGGGCGLLGMRVAGDAGCGRLCLPLLRTVKNGVSHCEVMVWCDAASFSHGEKFRLALRDEMYKLLILLDKKICLI
jgi:hypothetical protein